MSKDSAEAGLNKVLWQRNDGLVRVVVSFYGEDNKFPELIVEGKGEDAMGVEGWHDTAATEQHLEAFALSLLGIANPDHGNSGELVLESLLHLSRSNAVNLR